MNRTSLRMTGLSGLALLIASLLTAEVLDVGGRDISDPQRHPAQDSPDIRPLPSRQPIGDIVFDPYVTYTTGSFAEVVAIQDMNNDGLNDVILGTSFYSDSLNDYKIFVFTQNSSGELAAPVKYDGGDIRAIDTGDLNSDSLQDVVIGFKDSIGIYFQNASGTLESMEVHFSGRQVDGVKIGDLNNDDLMDVAVCHWNTDSIKIFVQEPYGSFDSSLSYFIESGGYDEIDIGDVTGDGLNDIIFMRGQGTANENIAVFAQDSSGELTSPVFLGLGDTLTSGIAVGDVNDDDRNDVVATYGGNRPGSNVAVWLQDSSGVLQIPPTSYACHDCPEPVEIADLDLDGLNDVIVANGGWCVLSIYQQNETGALNAYSTAAIPYASHYRPQGLAVGDFTNDGKPDIAIADYNNGLVILRNQSRPPAPDIELSDTIHDFGDVTPGDSLDWELVIRNVGTDTLIVDSMPPISPVFSFESSAFPCAVTPGDSIQATIWFMPDTAVAYSDTVTIFSNDPHEPISKVTLEGEGLLGTEEAVSSIPSRFFLSQNRPNPFSHYTRIQYELPERANANIAIYNLSGQRVATLLDRKVKPGYHTAVWNGKSISGKRVSSGVYFCRFVASGANSDDFTAVRKIYLVR